MTLPAHQNKAPLYRQRGLMYIEVLIAVVIIVITLVPLMDSLWSGMNGSDIYEERVEQHYHLSSRMEEMLAEPYDSLLQAANDAAGHLNTSSYSDAVGSTMRRLVYLSAYDADNADGDGDAFTGTDSEILWVRVTLEGTHHAMETVTAK